MSQRKPILSVTEKDFETTEALEKGPAPGSALIPRELLQLEEDPANQKEQFPPGLLNIPENQRSPDDDMWPVYPSDLEARDVARIRRLGHATSSPPWFLEQAEATERRERQLNRELERSSPMVRELLNKQLRNPRRRR